MGLRVKGVDLDFKRPVQSASKQGAGFKPPVGDDQKFRTFQNQF